MKTLLVIDGQGGGCGRALVERLRAAGCPARIHAVGTNAAATAAMLRAGAHTAATGENAVVVGCRRAALIAGPIGIVMADSMMGEFTSLMARAVADSPADRVLIPVNRCNTYIAGTSELSLGQSLDKAVELIVRLLSESSGECQSCE